MRYCSELPRFQMQAAQENSYLAYNSLLNVESSPHKTIRATSIACNVGKDIITICV